MFLNYNMLFKIIIIIFVLLTLFTNFNFFFCSDFGLFIFWICIHCTWFVCLLSVFLTKDICRFYHRLKNWTKILKCSVFRQFVCFFIVFVCLLLFFCLIIWSPLRKCRQTLWIASFINRVWTLLNISSSGQFNIAQ